MQIKLLIEGGNMQPGPALSQKLGPAGINLGQVIQKVNDSTKDFKGLKVPVELEVDLGTKEFEVNVFSPPVSELLKRELGIEKGAELQAKMQVANASIEQVISVAKTKLPTMLCKDLKSAVKTIVGTCTSLGILIEGKPASKVGGEIDTGKYAKEIQEEKTETSPEKKAKLEKEFKELHTKQEKAIEQEEAEKEAEKEAAAEAAKEGEETPEEEETAEAPAEGEATPEQEPEEKK
jgi:large subunit ribosomal protein L11